MELRGQRVRIDLRGWMRSMAIQYCGQDYGSELKNAYMFYRACYGMRAEQALQEARRWDGVL